MIVLVSTDSCDFTINGEKSCISFQCNRMDGNKVNVILVEDQGGSAEGTCTVEDIEEVLARIKAYRDGKPVPSADVR